MADEFDFDFSLFGDTITKPSTGESADPSEILAGKVVCTRTQLITRTYLHDLVGSVSFSWLTNLSLSSSVFFLFLRVNLFCCCCCCCCANSFLLRIVLVLVVATMLFHGFVL
jgi:hypothetical protein